MSQIRSPAVAGMFYPANAQELRSMVEQMLADVDPAIASDSPPKAIIAPHAGYIYSGPVAASAYASLRQASSVISRVVLLGPAHRVPVHGLALPASDAFATPLGKIEIDREAVEQIRGLPQVRVFDDAHTLEHSLEVHLPFLQSVLADFQLVPLVVGDASAEEVAEVLERLWGGPETLIVISSDLSHYHDYQTARQMDSATSLAIEHLAYDEIHFDQACGRTPVSGLLLQARKRGLKGKTIDLRNSGDTAGPRNQVVGYGAYVFH
ncbi:MAG: AmmeMemoRadiSam system protein B [Acidiferrobacterales bacterium]|nr:AmmeMemoRadiSam system protein B [Acidiferrobacterales bacterium]